MFRQVSIGRRLVFWGMLALSKQIVLSPSFSSKYFCISVFSHLLNISICVCAHVQSYWRQLLTFLIMFLVPHQNFYYHTYSTAMESTTAQSVIRWFSSDFSNEIEASPLVQWPVPTFFVFLLTFFAIQILAFQVLHNTLLQSWACSYHSVH